MEVDVPQCGYCQAGQMMSASALLATKPQPTDKDIDTAMYGNLCRCGTYLRIRQAIHRAAQLASSRPVATGGGAGSARELRRAIMKKTNDMKKKSLVKNIDHCSLLNVAANCTGS